MRSLRRGIQAEAGAHGRNTSLRLKKLISRRGHSEGRDRRFQRSLADERNGEYHTLYASFCVGFRGSSPVQLLSKGKDFNAILKGFCYRNGRCVGIRTSFSFATPPVRSPSCSHLEGDPSEIDMNRLSEVLVSYRKGNKVRCRGKVTRGNPGSHLIHSSFFPWEASSCVGIW